MKIRLSFVSNSSSCSFCIYGIQIDDKLLRSILEDPENSKTSREMHFDYWFPPSISNDDCAFGVSFRDFPEDKTIAETKKNIELILKKWFGEDIEPSVWEEGWYDG